MVFMGCGYWRMRSAQDATGGRARRSRAELAIEHPRLVVEVLSGSTAACDRSIEFVAYRKLADLRECLLVDVDQRRLELHRREAGHWILLESEGDGPALRLESVDMTLSPAEAFEDLNEEARPER